MENHEKAVSTCPLSGRKSGLDAEPPAGARFVAINYIDCKDHYRERFECLFCSRARAIDTMPGFVKMNVLKCEDESQPYLIVSYWESKECFDAWVGSPEFKEGHKRGFEDIIEAKKRGEEPPMKSDFKTYSIISD